MEIDVDKCEYYYLNYCECYRDNYGDYYHKCTDEELKDCYYRQLQQYKKCLDEIEDILLDSYITSYDICIMLEKIKEVKG